MSKQRFISITCGLILFSGFAAESQRFTDYVNPYIGSGGHGHVFVGANVPFGAVQVGPSNFFKGWDWCSGYNYRDSVIIGFPQLHLSGTGIGDLGDILIMPYMGDVKLQKGKETERYSGYASRFSHSSESVRPGYYSVMLDDYQIRVELTASERVAFHRYHFPQGRQARIIIDLQEGINDKSVETHLQLIDRYTIHGYRSSEGWAKRQQVFFAIRSSVPLTGFSVYDGEKPLAGKTGRGVAVKGLITFEQSPGEVLLKVGISPVSAANARANIQSEIPGWDFDGVLRQANEKWNRELSKIDITTSNEADRRIFYTAMYHAMMHPSLFDDANGDRMGADWKVHRKAGFDNYTVFSLWDTYRAAHPLFTIIDTRRTADFVNTMLAVFDETGALPIWHLRGYDTGTMVGINSFQVIAEAYLKGVGGFDAGKAFQAMKTTAMSDMRGLDYDRDLKPIPSDVMTNRPVAMALEYAIGTASIALMAKKMGKMEDYDYFSRRAENYRLYFDRETGFFRGKMADGSWNPVFDPIKSKRPWATDYAEGNAWQYLWLVPHDVEGLIRLTGGEQAFEDRLNTFFSLTADDEDVLVDLTGCIGQYAHGNEPSHHIASLYAYVGQQWKTARLTRRIIRDFYSDRPDGIIGNEDCGQMSAWYIFSSLGFYPVFTASGQYVLGSPLFDRATIRLESGKTFTVEAIHNSPENIYIQSVELNGKAYPFSYIRHDDLMRGGVLTIRMGSTPNYRFGQDPVTRPQTRSADVRLSKPFVRPGMAQSREDLDYMKQQVADGKEPWRTAFVELKRQTSPDFRPAAVAFVSEGPYGENSIGGREFHRSSTEAYANAVLWYITGERQYAGKAIEILNAWSSKLRSFDANNAKLNVGLYAYYFLNAAEILEHSDAGWNEKDRAQFRNMVLTVFYPTIEDFFTEANGNWDASMISTMLCIGVYTERLDIFNRAVERFYWGTGNSGITRYVYPGGQCQEATRDWDHVQLGIGELAKAAQTALTQGLDFYGVAQDRLAYAYEQCSRMMLGDGEPDIFGVLSKRGRERYKDIYESFYDYYTNVRGIALPYTREVILNHTRAQFPLGTLTGLRRFPVPAPESLAALPASNHLKASATGVLEQNTRAFRAGDIVVRVGENIQEAIDRNKGKSATIVLEKGVHMLHAPLKISGGLTLAGCGRETVLFLSPELRTETVTTDGDELTDVTIRDLLIEGAVSVTENSDPNHDRRTRSYMSAPSREGIVIRSERGAEISRLTFENITVRNFTKNGLLIVGASNVRISRCDFSDNGSSVVPGAGFHHNLHLSHVTDVEIADSRFDTSPFGNGVALLSSRNVRMTGNEMCRNGRSGIYCADSENVTVLDNLSEGNDLDGISLDAMATNCKSVTVRGNLLQHNGRHGIKAVRVARLTEDDNTDLFNRCRPSIDVPPAIIIRAYDLRSL